MVLEMRSWGQQARLLRNTPLSFFKNDKTPLFNSSQHIQRGGVSPVRGQKAQKGGCLPTNEAPAASKHNRPLWQQQGGKNSQRERNRSSANKTRRVCFCESVGPDTRVVEKADMFTSQATWTFSSNKSSSGLEKKKKKKDIPEWLCSATFTMIHEVMLN